MAARVDESMHDADYLHVEGITDHKMSISFNCSQCGRSYTVDDAFAGKKVRCKPCGATMRIPSSSSSGGQPPAEEAPPEDLYGLADDEPALPPRAPQAGPNLPASDSRSKPKPKAKAGAGSSSTKAKAFGGGGALVFVALVVLRIVLRLNRGDHAQHAGEPALPPPPPPVVVASAPADGPAFSPRGEGAEIRPGVRFFETKASGPADVATARMTVWVYLPDGPHEPHTLPCVVVAPAGSIIITGMDLGDGDRAEHFPYVASGYAVLSYSLDGHIENVQAANDAQIARATAEFVAAEAGLANARAAIDWMLKNFPEVDPERLYTAGHSSAGTMALLLAEHDARLKACAAFDPRSNTEGNFQPPQLAALRHIIPVVDQIFTAYNPAKHAGEMKCPVLLFHAQDDEVVPVSETDAFASALKSAGKEVTVDPVPSGGHFQPMISQGIPHAIAYFAEHGSGAQGHRADLAFPSRAQGSAPAWGAQPARRGPAGTGAAGPAGTPHTPRDWTEAPAVVIDQIRSDPIRSDQIRLSSNSLSLRTSTSMSKGLSRLSRIETVRPRS
jgi:dienelactone hydrolase